MRSQTETHLELDYTKETPKESMGERQGDQ